MNILTFDIEEWYTEKVYHGARASRYREFDDTLAKVLDELDRVGCKGTFFCVGKLALEFPDVVRRIASRGHEIGCHSHEHVWINKMTEDRLFEDTTEALKALEDVAGQKVTSYRAPAFSITDKTPWAVKVLAECGIKSDASIFPGPRDFGGFPSFPQDTPCKIEYQGTVMKEYPIGMMSLAGRRIAYSGGGYFRLIPYWMTSRTIKRRDYDICYFHLNDLIAEKRKLRSRADYEAYFMQPGTLKNRLIRYFKSNARTGDTLEKLIRLLTEHQFVNIHEADKQIDWAQVKTISLSSIL
ncbi:MAG: polysaccharide deacetylase family protein [Prevotella sp.]|nr:polysaccharide deacetylase family protein [Prevotella sp.]MBO7539832.1 polysaccharide deacetylase family protein [Prevotella sp.]